VIPFVSALCRDAACAHVIEDELQQRPVRIADADDDAATSPAMFATKCDRALPIDEAGHIGGNLFMEAMNPAIRGHRRILLRARLIT
jgi:hypothetical protein